MYLPMSPSLPLPGILSLHMVSFSMFDLVLPSLPIIYLKKTDGMGRCKTYPPPGVCSTPSNSRVASSPSSYTSSIYVCVCVCSRAATTCWYMYKYHLHLHMVSEWAVRLHRVSGSKTFDSGPFDIGT